MRLLPIAPVLVAGLVIVLASHSSHAAVEGNVRISVNGSGGQLALPSGAYSYSPSISADGGVVAFQTLARMPEDGDTNDVEDVFLRRVDGPQITLVSVSSSGAQGNNRSYGPDVSAGGGLVVFESLASNLVTGDANGAPDVFLRDMEAGATTRISTAAGDADADGASTRPAISGDGSRVAFCSRASNLTTDDDNGAADVFLYERAAQAFQRIAVDGGASALESGCLRVAINSDGSAIAYSAATGGRTSVYLWTEASGSADLTPSADGPSGSSGVAISGDGRYVAFDSEAANVVPDDENRSRDVFVHDVEEGTTTLVSARSDGSGLPGDSGGSGVAMSGDGRYVVFGSAARQVVQGDTDSHEDVFRRDLTSGETAIASLSRSGRQANNSSYAPEVNGDGSAVAFTSLAANLVLGDQNREADVFVRGSPFLDRSGEGDAPLVTGAPEELPSRPLTGGEDDGLLSVPFIAGGAAVFVLLLVASWFILGRRARA